MIQGITRNLDFLAARLHGRHSRMAKGARLEALCRVRSLPHFASEVWSGADTGSATEIQRRLVQDLAEEMAGIAAQLSSAGAALLRWRVVRFQVENLKVIVRCLMAGVQPASWLPHLVTLPRQFALDAETLATARTLDQLVQLLPRGPLRRSLGEAVGRYRAESHPFFLEAVLDRAYFVELLARTDALHGEDKELVTPLVHQEIDTFHLALVARGRFGHRLAAEALLPLHVSGTGIPRERFAAMLTDPDLRTATSRALGRVLDRLPRAPGESSGDSGSIVPADLEPLAGQRCLRLANRAFRRSHMGLAAVVAFVEMRRVEVANLITLSEGIRAQLPERQLRSRLSPRPSLEVPHV